MSADLIFEDYDPDFDEDYEQPTPSELINGVVIRLDPHWNTWTAELDYYGVHDTDRTNRCTLHPVAWTVEFCGPRNDLDASHAAAVRIAANREGISAIVLDQAARTRRPHHTHQRLYVEFDGDQMTVREYDHGRWTQTVPVTPKD
jgi:hypothetical protein